MDTNESTLSASLDTNESTVFGNSSIDPSALNNSTRNIADDYIAGSCFVVTSILGLLAYSAVMPAIALTKNLHLPCYTLMFSLGVSDCISLVAWLIIGIDTLSHGWILPNLLITHSLTALVIGWGSLTIHTAVLAINRYIGVCHTDKHDDLFSKKRMYFVIGGCWAYVLCFHSVPTFIPPHMVYTVDGYVATWENPKITAYYFVQDLCAVSTVSLLDATCYTAIIVRFRKIRQQLTMLSSDAAESRRRQFRLAVQCMVRCAAFFSCDLLYYLFGYAFVVDNFWFNFVMSTYLWHINNVLSPWVYLTFDTQLRKAVRNLFLKKKQQSQFNGERLFQRTSSIKNTS